MTSNIQARRAGQRGFTLVELLVVIAIIAVLAGLLLPALGHAFLNPRAHARDGWNLLFGDGHAGLVAIRKLRWDPQAYLGALDWSSPGWADVD